MIILRDASTGPIRFKMATILANVSPPRSQNFGFLKWNLFNILFWDVSTSFIWFTLWFKMAPILSELEYWKFTHKISWNFKKTFFIYLDTDDVYTCAIKVSLPFNIATLCTRVKYIRVPHFYVGGGYYCVGIILVIIYMVWLNG